MIKEIKVDQNACVGCGACTIVAPEAFEINSQGVSQAKSQTLDTTEEVLLKAAQVCPVKAILLVDENQNIIFPKA